MSAGQRGKLGTTSLKLAEMRSTSDSGVTELSDAVTTIDLGPRDQYVFPQGISVTLTGSTDATLTADTVKRKSKVELMQETKEKERKINNIFRRMKKARKVYLCFLVDCTGSMSQWINEVKTNVKNWSRKLSDEYMDTELHVAFVRYTDYDQPEDTRTTSIDFTDDLDRFYRFVDAITTPGGVGGDTAEDVFGGLHKALKLTWPKEGTKVLVHITDAPCHGKQYHNSSTTDDYPEGDPSGLQLSNLMRLVAAQSIAYYFGYIDRYATDEMMKAFNLSLKEESSRMMNLTAFDVSKAEDVFEGVYMSVTSSISTYVNTLIHSEKDETMPLRDFTIENMCPDWSRVPAKSAEVRAPPPQGAGVEAMPKSRNVSLKIAPQPFGDGSQRIAFHGYDPSERKHLVFKQFKWESKRLNCSKRFYEVVQVYAVASNFAAEFNKQSPSGTVEIKFNPVGFAKFTDRGKKNYFSYEPFLEGEYIKYTNNVDYIRAEKSKFSNACQAFSHFSWTTSQSQLVCDLQGVASKDGCSIILTDPAIHDTNLILHGSTNLGDKGINAFFLAHACNHICSRMKLKRPSM